MKKHEIFIGIAVFFICAIGVVAFAKYAASAHKAALAQSSVMEAAAAQPPAAASVAPPAASDTPAAMAALAPSAGKPAPAAAPQPVQAKEDPPRDFDDWRLACATPPKGKKQCTMFQRVAVKKDKQQQVALAATVQTGEIKDKDAMKTVTLIRIITPLGTVLTPGMAIKIDEEKEIKVPYSQCLPGGCRADLIFDQPTLDKMRKGKTMFVAYRLPDGKDTTFPISLKGFATALDAMTQTTSKG